MFRGRVVEVADQPAKAGQIFVMGKNGSLRKVQVEAAEVEYSDEVPAKFRKSKAADSLVRGSEIRVEAEEGASGSWTAKSIEILQVPGSPKPKDATPSGKNKRVAPPMFSKRTSFK